MKWKLGFRSFDFFFFCLPFRSIDERERASPRERRTVGEMTFLASVTRNKERNVIKKKKKAGLRA